MSYWGDRRDNLEKLFPTCTSFCDYHPQYPDGLIERTNKGLIFLMAFWSGPAVSRFKTACYSLEDSVPWDQFSFDVVDVDGLQGDDPFSSYEQLDGYGEVFWIRDGRIVASMGRDWMSEKFDENTQRVLDA